MWQGLAAWPCTCPCIPQAHHHRGDDRPAGVGAHHRRWRQSSRDLHWPRVGRPQRPRRLHNRNWRGLLSDGGVGDGVHQGGQRGCGPLLPLARPRLAVRVCCVLAPLHRAYTEAKDGLHGCGLTMWACPQVAGQGRQASLLWVHMYQLQGLKQLVDGQGGDKEGGVHGRARHAMARTMHHVWVHVMWVEPKWRPAITHHAAWGVEVTRWLAKAADRGRWRQATWPSPHTTAGRPDARRHALMHAHWGIIEAVPPPLVWRVMLAAWRGIGQRRQIMHPVSVPIALPLAVPVPARPRGGR
mmetsp:Transcript_4080/g.8892  ORF Transcript_4080/g.8892 Transcript_4080/m.8892 type:complete len:298 (-) Transcript_4080:437-1330(-)